MSRYAQQPATPIRQTKSRPSPFLPLTPQTPSSGTKSSLNASPVTNRTPLAPYNNVAFTPPPSLPRAPRTLFPKKSFALDSWRKLSEDIQDSTSVAPHDDLLPPAFISTQRRISLPKQDLRSPNASKLSKRSGKAAEVSAAEGSGFTIPTPMNTPAREKDKLRSSDVTHLQYATPSLRRRSPGAMNKISCASCGSSEADVMLSCSHAMCSGCFTASLNIVGEKRFSCPKCFEPILDFRFTSSKPTQPLTPSIDIRPQVASKNASDTTSLHDSFEDITPEKYAVLRLDDVPWDVTPRMLGEWASIPSQQAHVLLDRDGKTLSHAFIEAHPHDVRETLAMCRNKVLGTGKRARRVTITTSSQDELLHQLFPAWPGKFMDSRPSISHLQPHQMPPLLGNGILPLDQLEILAKRILHPDRRYVKDPALPYGALISVINKFPFDSDSRIFWNYGTTDTLFAIAYSAILQLVNSEQEEWKQVVMRSLAEAIFRVPIFSNEQIQQVHGLLEVDRVHATSSSDASTSSTAPIATPPPEGGEQDNTYAYAPDVGPVHAAWSPYDAIAEELGVEPHIVQAVCERLANCALI